MAGAKDSLLKGRYDVTGTFRREGVMSSRVARSFQASERSLPKGSCDVITCREVSFQASKGSLSKGSCDVIACREVSFQASEGSLPKGRCDVVVCRECWSVANLTAWCSGPRGCASKRDVLLLDAVRLCVEMMMRFG
ncbi:unnamed protein product [Prunus armeniaca]